MRDERPIAAMAGRGAQRRGRRFQAADAVQRRGPFELEIKPLARVLQLIRQIAIGASGANHQRLVGRQLRLEFEVHQMQEQLRATVAFLRRNLARGVPERRAFASVAPMVKRIKWPIDGRRPTWPDRR